MIVTLIYFLQLNSSTHSRILLALIARLSERSMMCVSLMSDVGWWSLETRDISAWSVLDHLPSCSHLPHFTIYHDEILSELSVSYFHHLLIILITTLGLLKLPPGPLFQQVPLISSKNTQGTPRAVSLQEELQQERTSKTSVPKADPSLWVWGVSHGSFQERKVICDVPTSQHRTAEIFSVSGGVKTVLVTSPGQGVKTVLVTISGLRHSRGLQARGQHLAPAGLQTRSVRHLSWRLVEISGGQVNYILFFIKSVETWVLSCFCRCDSLLQNPQYQCVMEEVSSIPFPDCCAHPKECRQIGPQPQ